MKLPSDNRFSGFKTKSAGGGTVVSVFREGPVSAADLRQAMEAGEFNLVGKELISTPPEQLENQMRRRAAGVAIAQCVGTTLGCTLAFSGIHNIVDAARGNGGEDDNRWARAAVGAGKVAAGAAALYYSLVKPPSFMR